MQVAPLKNNIYMVNRVALTMNIWPKFPSMVIRTQGIDTSFCDLYLWISSSLKYILCAILAHVENTKLHYYKIIPLFQDMLKTNEYSLKS